MHGFDFFAVFLRPALTVLGVLNEEGVVCISGWMALRLKQRIEVPERALNVPIGRHLSETHAKEDLLELLPDHQKRMQVTARKWHTCRGEVVLLELLVLPAAIPHHFSRQFSLQFDSFDHILRPF